MCAVVLGVVPCWQSLLHMNSAGTFAMVAGNQAVHMKVQIPSLWNFPEAQLRWAAASWKERRV
jgi:hypothetical protein